MVLRSFSKQEGLWPASLSHRISRPLWLALGHCPGLAPLLLERQFRQWCEGKRYSIPAALVVSHLSDPLTVQFSPQNLQQRLAAVKYNGQGRAEYDLRHQFIGSGDLSLLLSPVADSQLNREIDELFLCGMNWQQTASYQTLAQKLRDKGSFLHNNIRFKSLKDIDRYFERYVRLSDSIDRFGYLSRSQLKKKHRSGLGRLWQLEQGEEEVGIAIGPKGQVWRYRGGYHRTAIARNLGLKTMPVMIKLVHEDWLRDSLLGCSAVMFTDVCSALVGRVQTAS